LNKIVKKVVTSVAALALVSGVTLGSMVVRAEPAQAWTQSCHQLDAGYGRIIGGSPWPGYRYATACYVDYSWWEEVSFPWPRDQWFIYNYHN
jgi:hypothetical protein